MEFLKANTNGAVRKIFASTLLAAAFASAAAAQDRLPLDRETQEGGGIAVVCTGVGSTSR